MALFILIITKNENTPGVNFIKLCFPYFHKYGKIFRFYGNTENDQLNSRTFFHKYGRFSCIHVKFSHIYMKYSRISVNTGKSPVLPKYGNIELRNYGNTKVSFN